MRTSSRTRFVGLVITCAIIFFVPVICTSHPAAAMPDPEESNNFNRIVIPTGHRPGSIAVADVNHDGRPDVIVANTEDETVTVLLGDGKGHFTIAPGSPFPCGKAPSDIAVADMNGDGNPDLVIANTGTPFITILLGDGKGGFAPSQHSPFATQSYPHVHGVVAADFTGNGRLAVITDSLGPRSNSDDSQRRKRKSHSAGKIF